MPAAFNPSDGLPRGIAALVFAFVAALCALLLLSVIGRPTREPALTLSFVAIVAASSALATLLLWRVRASVWSGLAIGAVVPLFAVLALALAAAATPLCPSGGYLECMAKATLLFGLFAGLPAAVVGMLTGGALGVWAVRRRGRARAAVVAGNRA